MFECDECERAFSTKRGLSLHQRTHFAQNEQLPENVSEDPVNGLQVAVDETQDDSSEDRPIDGFHGAMYRATMEQRGIDVAPGASARTTRAIPVDRMTAIRRLDTGGM